jgi:hypothetical protein
VTWSLLEETRKVTGEKKIVGGRRSKKKFLIRRDSLEQGNKCGQGDKFLQMWIQR